MDLDLEEAISNLEKELVPHTELVHILHKCRRERDRSLAVRLHACLKKVEVDTSLGNALVVLLAGVGCIVDAQQVFDGLLHQDANSWSSLISAYVKYHKPQHALAMYQNMQMDASMHYPSAHAFVSLLKACAKLKHFEMGVLSRVCFKYFRYYKMYSTHKIQVFDNYGC